MHLFFPSVYYHFDETTGAPAGLHNDGLLDIRLLISGAADGRNVTYTDAEDARSRRP